MLHRTALLLAATMFAAPVALAQQSGPYDEGPPTQAQMNQMCRSIYASQAGQLADLESALSLTDAQRGPFEQWRSVVLGAAKAQSAACLAHEPGRGHAPDALERNSEDQQALESRLQDLRAERPALEALYRSLSPQQRETFNSGGDEEGPGEDGPPPGAMPPPGGPPQ